MRTWLLSLASRIAAPGLALLLFASCAPPSGPPRPSPRPDARSARASAADSATAAPTFRVREWTISDGLPTPVIAVDQTPDGYLWITTFDGLVRFDGVRFVRFTTANTPVFRSHDFVGVYATRSGDLWVGGRDLWAYRLHDGAWTAYDLGGLIDRHWVQSFAEDAQGTLWLATTGPYVARFDGERWVLADQQIRDVWTPFVADAEGTVWTLLPASAAPGAPLDPFYGGVVARWDGDQFVPADGAPSSGFAASQYGPLFHQVHDDAEAVTVTDAAGRTLGTFPLDGVPAAARLVDRTGRLWVHPLQGDDQGTLFVYQEGREVARFEPEGATAIEQVFEDRQGSVWVHARSTGLIQISEDPFRRYVPADGAPRFAIRTSLDTAGAVVVSPEWGSDEPRVARTDGTRLLDQTYAPGRGQTPVSNRFVTGGQLEVGQVVEDKVGQRFGLLDRCVFRLDGGRAQSVWCAEGEELWSLDPDPVADGIVWVGSLHGLVTRLDTRRGVATDTVRFAGRIHFVRQTSDGRRWVASERGLAVLEGGALRVIRDAAIDGQSVRDLVERPDGALWIATAGGGLVRLRDGEARALGMAEGLPTDHVSAILPDDVGHVWLSGRQSLHRVRADVLDAAFDGAPVSIDAVTLPPSAGHLGTSNKVVGVARAPDGSFWIPSFKGVTRLDPALFARLHAEPPPTVVESFRAEDGTTFRPTDGLRLPVGLRTIEAEYTAADFLAPDLVRFRTFLEGHDDDWVDRGTTRRATYGGLAPGRYVLHVQAMTANGTWGEAAATPTFVVPPWAWETWWFRALVALGLGGLTAVAYRARVRTLTDRQRALSGLVAARTAELTNEKETVAAQAEALRALDAAKTQLFANVSHEFRTPLTLTIGPLDDVLAGEHGPIPAAAQEQLALARRSAARVLRLVGQILDVARLESGRTPLRAQPVDLGAFAAALAAAVAPLADRKDIAFSVAIPNDPVEIWADPVQLEKAVSNLLSNALKFTPTGGTVRVSVEVGTEAASITVRDNGPGIPAADLPHVFDRFHQSDGADRLAEPGTGIGLALAREVAELHGGAIRVESEEGFGSLFVLSLPLGRAHLRDDQVAAAPAPWTPHAPLASAESPPADAADDAEDRTTVLVVEDNAEVRAYVRRHLAPTYRVIEAADGAAGLAMARERLPDLVLSDIMMPKMDGIALLDALKSDSETDFVPVVLLTARAEVEDRLGGLASGADDYLTKPFDVRELRARVDNLIASRRRLRERFAIDADGEPGGDGTLHAGPVDPDSADNVFLEAVREVVERHLGDEAFSVERLAEAVGVSRGHLHRQLRALDGRTPSEVIRTMRLERAAQLLAAGAGTVSEVAYAVGFKSVSHFSRAFDGHLGVRPSQYAAGA